jgi:hypothetical protein
MFAAGAAIGSVVTWKVVKTRYEQIVQEEIASIKEALGNGLPELPVESEEETSDDEADPREGSTRQINWAELEDLDEDLDDEVDEAVSDYAMSEYRKIVRNYTNKKGGAESVDNTAKEPYVISPDDFGELDDYKRVELTYYADGTLEDSEYNIITDIDGTIGEDSLRTFGQYEDDSVFVRNERLRTEYEILMDYRTYEQARSIGPGRVHDE